MTFARRIPVAVKDVKSHLSNLKGDRLAICLIGDYSVLEIVASSTGALNLNSLLLDSLEEKGRLEEAYELESVQDKETIRKWLEEGFKKVLHHHASSASWFTLSGFESLIHFGVNLRWVRQYAVNDRPIGLIIPGSIKADEVWFFDEHPIDCEFDQIWEVRL